MKRKYIYTLTIEEDNDEFWENPDLKISDVTEELKEAFNSYGWMNITLTPKQVIYNFEDNDDPEI